MWWLRWALFIVLALIGMVLFLFFGWLFALVLFPALAFDWFRLRSRLTARVAFLATVPPVALGLASCTAVGVAWSAAIVALPTQPQPERQLARTEVASASVPSATPEAGNTQPALVASPLPPTATLTPPTATPTPDERRAATVVRVVDGDTVDVQLAGRTERLRLIGMDTPETVDPRQPVQCFGREASARAKALLPEGTQVRIAGDPTQDTRDQYGRLLVYLWLPDGRLFNEVMIAEGYAHEYTYRVPYQRQVAFKQAEREAREAGRGLWAPSACNGDTLRPADLPAPTATRRPTVVATAAPAPPAPSNVYYPNCAAARAAGAAPIYRGQPGYRPGLDRDGDGVACE